MPKPSLDFIAQANRAVERCPLPWDTCPDGQPCNCALEVTRQAISQPGRYGITVRCPACGGSDVEVATIAHYPFDCRVCGNNFSIR